MTFKLFLKIERKRKLSFTLAQKTNGRITREKNIDKMWPTRKENDVNKATRKQK